MQRIVEMEAQQETHELDMTRIQAANTGLRTELTDARGGNDLLRASIKVLSWTLAESCMHATVLSARGPRVMFGVPGL